MQHVTDQRPPGLCGQAARMKDPNAECNHMQSNDMQSADRTVLGLGRRARFEWQLSLLFHCS